VALVTDGRFSGATHGIRARTLPLRSHARTPAHTRTCPPARPRPPARTPARTHASVGPSSAMVGHVSPEAAAGACSPLALVKTGDVITIDVAAGRAHVTLRVAVYCRTSSAVRSAQVLRFMLHAACGLVSGGGGGGGLICVAAGTLDMQVDEAELAVRRWPARGTCAQPSLGADVGESRRRCGRVLAEMCPGGAHGLPFSHSDKSSRCRGGGRRTRRRCSRSHKRVS
jgi:hypothetical protein